MSVLTAMLAIAAVSKLVVLMTPTTMKMNDDNDNGNDNDKPEDIERHPNIEGFVRLFSATRR